MKNKTCNGSCEVCDCGIRKQSAYELPTIQKRVREN